MTIATMERRRGRLECSPTYLTPSSHDPVLNWTSFKDKVLFDLASNGIGPHEQANDDPVLAFVGQQVANQVGPARAVAGAHGNLGRH